jgi:putative polyhydroxyalkanoate system protein
MPGATMPSIKIEREHTVGLTKAKAAVDEVAKAMQEKFQVDAKWVKNTLQFERSGVKGEIAVSKDKVDVAAELGFMLGFLKGRIEQEINQHLDKALS